MILTNDLVLILGTLSDPLYIYIYLKSLKITQCMYSWYVRLLRRQATWKRHITHWNLRKELSVLLYKLHQIGWETLSIFSSLWSRCVRIHEVCVKYTSALIHALQIVDEKQLLKRYQKEIMSLKEELNQLKRGTPEEDLISIREEVLIFVLWKSFALSKSFLMKRIVFSETVIMFSIPDMLLNPWSIKIL